MMVSQKTIKDIDIEFSHTPRRMAALRDCPEVKMAGLAIGPFKRGEIFEIEYSIGRILKKRGIAKFEDELLNREAILKIHWKEGVQTAERLSTLPEHFYPMLRQLLSDLKEKGDSPDKIYEYRRMLNLSLDIVNRRLRKVLKLTAITAPPQTLEKLAPDERFLYDRIHSIIEDWRSSVLGKR